MANVKIPYSMTPAVAIDQRRANQVSAIARGLPRLKRQPVDDSKTLHIACFGPSLRETWPELKGKSPIISMSGATRFLVERGIVPTYAIEMDPRESQLTVSLPPISGVTYLVASCVCPAYFDRVIEAGNDIVLWHAVSANWEEDLAWVGANDPDELLISAGQTVGLGAIHVGGVLGYTRFEIHGMDGSFVDGQRHAAFHGGKSQPDNITWDACGKTYRTSKIMANAVAESINTAKNFPIITVWHGDGLTQALIREANLSNACCADEVKKREGLSHVRPRIMHAPPLRGTFWESLLDALVQVDLPELVSNIATCESRRSLARYNTGTIPFESAAYLRAMSRFYEPNVIVEVGTFIGTSTHALLPKRVLYTCDSRNDCVPLTESVITHPYQTSTQMLREIQEQVDLFFFDGRIQPEDLAEIKRLSHPGTVYVVDDHVGNEKGVANVHALAALIPTHTLIPPLKGSRSTLAAMVPFLPRRAQ